MPTGVQYLSEVVMKFTIQRSSRTIENAAKFYSYFRFIATNNEKYSVLREVKFTVMS
jgi:hypothetical protein